VGHCAKPRHRQGKSKNFHSAAQMMLIFLRCAEFILSFGKNRRRPAIQAKKTEHSF
jgi:hypothetical protein